jgi:hypothetical protein
VQGWGVDAKLFAEFLVARGVVGMGVHDGCEVVCSGEWLG